MRPAPRGASRAPSPPSDGAGAYLSTGSGEARAGRMLWGLLAGLGYTGSSSSLSGVGIKEQGSSQAGSPSQGWKGKTHHKCLVSTAILTLTGLQSSQ